MCQSIYFDICFKCVPMSIMARERRIEYPGAKYHVTAWGNRREPIVHDDEDRMSFERTLEQVVDDFGIELIAHMLMG